MKENRLIIGLVLLLTIVATAGKVQAEPPAVFYSDSTHIQTTTDQKVLRRKKVVAVGLATLLGPFGVHRLYLGTDPKIPVIYSITFGAFGILPLTDIIAILTTREIDQYTNNSHIIMWMK